MFYPDNYLGSLSGYPDKNYPDRHSTQQPLSNNLNKHEEKSGRIDHTSLLMYHSEKITSK